MQDASDPHSWLHTVAQSVAAGALSVGATDSIQSGLGHPDSGASERDLGGGAERLCPESATLDADRLYRRVRELRDELDEADIAAREAERRTARSLTFTPLPNGMSRLTCLMDPETVAVTRDLSDRATSPRRSGPRVVDGGIAAFDGTDFDPARRITDDTRSTAQLASGVLVEHLRQGAAADSTQ